MAQDPIIIKGTRHGLEIVFDSDYTFEELKISLAHKLESAHGFFEGAKFSFRQESIAALTEENKSELLDICRQYGLTPNLTKPETTPAGDRDTEVSAPATTPQVTSADRDGRTAETNGLRQDDGTPGAASLAAEVRDGVPGVASPVAPADGDGLTAKAVRLGRDSGTPKTASFAAGVRDTADSVSKVTKPMVPVTEAGYTPIDVPQTTPVNRVRRAMEAAVAAASEALPGEEAVLVRRSLRSGQRITAKGHIVVMGDVNYGAEVIASGSVFVLGHCRGIIHAGSEGDSKARVLAWKLEPTVLSIAGRRQSANISRILPEGCHVAQLKGKEFIFQPYPK